MDEDNFESWMTGTFYLPTYMPVFRGGMPRYPSSFFALVIREIIIPFLLLFGYLFNIFFGFLILLYRPFPRQFIYRFFTAIASDKEAERGQDHQWKSEYPVEEKVFHVRSSHLPRKTLSHSPFTT